MLRIDKENGYYIDFCDSRCIALVQKVTLTRGNRKGETDFIVRGYYGSLQQLLNGYGRIEGACRKSERGYIQA